MIKIFSKLKFVRDETSCSLVIKRCFAEDAGEYTCIATNSVGKAESKCRLTVESKFLKFQVLSLSQLTIKNFCEIFAEITTIEESKEENAPQASDKAPIFLSALQPQTIQRDEDLELSVVVSGEPQPKLYFFHEKRKLHPGEMIKITEEIIKSPSQATDIAVSEVRSVLKIQKAQEFDSGKYTVRAINRCGVKSSSVNVTVKGIFQRIFVIHNPFAKHPYSMHRLFHAALAVH